jgi:hypothetical protein
VPDRRAFLCPEIGALLMPESINYTNGLSNAWSNVATFIPKLVVFLIIVIVGSYSASVSVLWLVAGKSDLE